ncbi:MAG: hypothetical protein ABIZ52_01150 [Candidatus Limnocylindrales bacterium]
MSAVIRGLLIVAGFMLMLGGLGIIVGVPAVGAWIGLQAVAFGAFLIVIVLIERHRYRSAAAEGTNGPPGPGGGEPAGTQVESRFRVTSERFIDPTTGVHMRVLVDPTNGERRYVAEP